MQSRLVKIIFIISILCTHIGCDQVTKEIARNSLRNQGRIEVLGDFFILHYVENEGAFLSLGAGLPPIWRTVLLIILPLAMLLALLVYLFSNPRLEPAWVVGLTLIAAGGISNLTDRLLNQGLVSDFMNLGFGPLRTGIFNFADLSIIFGAVVLIVAMIIQRRRGAGDEEARSKH